MNKYTVTKQHNGSLVVSTIYKGQYIALSYYGYNKREAMREFTEYLKGC